MARILKNGNLSGAVGNLVFVNSESQNYVRTKPSHLKQSLKTKAAAKAFGTVSAQDKLFRMELMRQFTLRTDNRYAARHRARMTKALGLQAQQNTEDTNANLGLPESLTHFDFNALCPWEKITRFYPEFKQPDTHQFECRLPALKAGHQIIMPKGATSAELRLDAFTVNPLGKTVHFNVLSTYAVEISLSQTTLPAIWTFGIPEDPVWLIVLGTLIFKSNANTGTADYQGGSTYLFAKSVVL